MRAAQAHCVIELCKLGVDHDHATAGAGADQLGIPMPSNEETIQRLERELRAVRHAFITALAWIGGSANSPLSVNEVRDLMQMAEPEKAKE